MSESAGIWIALIVVGLLFAAVFSEREHAVFRLPAALLIGISTVGIVALPYPAPSLLPLTAGGLAGLGFWIASQVIGMMFGDRGEPPILPRPADPIRVGFSGDPVGRVMNRVTLILVLLGIFGVVVFVMYLINLALAALALIAR